MICNQLILLYPFSLGLLVQHLSSLNDGVMFHLPSHLQNFPEAVVTNTIINILRGVFGTVVPEGPSIRRISPDLGFSGDWEKVLSVV